MIKYKIQSNFSFVLIWDWCRSKGLFHWHSPGLSSLEKERSREFSSLIFTWHSFPFWDHTKPTGKCHAIIPAAGLDLPCPTQNRKSHCFSCGGRVHLQLVDDHKQLSTTTHSLQAWYQLNFSLLLRFTFTSLPSVTRCFLTSVLCSEGCLLTIQNPMCATWPPPSTPLAVTRLQQSRFTNEQRPTFWRGLEVVCLLWFIVCGRVFVALKKTFFPEESCSPDQTEMCSTHLYRSLYKSKEWQKHSQTQTNF